MITLALALMKGVLNLQVMGDSQLVIDWIRLRRPLKNIYLRPLYEEIILLTVAFSKIAFKHIYRERNFTVDKMSKEGMKIGIVLWNRWKT